MELYADGQCIAVGMQILFQSAIEREAVAQRHNEHPRTMTPPTWLRQSDSVEDWAYEISAPDPSSCPSCCANETTLERTDACDEAGGGGPCRYPPSLMADEHSPISRRTVHRTPSGIQVRPVWCTFHSTAASRRRKTSPVGCSVRTCEKWPRWRGRSAPTRGSPTSTCVATPTASATAGTSCPSPAAIRPASVR
jgi:hypothetical protein